MEKQKHGGPAFPNSRHVGELTVVDGGMTLRDYFAAKALQSIIAEEGVEWRMALKISSAKTAYNYADAMLEARNKEQNKC